ncbi:MAG: hypothetical protein IJK24_04805 [Oscillospiraceae bacterium]|nr:hypothetical protein [Oscillospiraceae bacterium]
MDAKLRKAQKALDSLLRSLPDELAGLYASIDCEELLTQLAEQQDPAPAWLAAKARALRLKSHLLGSAVEALEARLSAAAADYQTAGGDDPIRLAHAETDRALLRARQEELARRQETANQLVRAAELAERQDEAAALVCSPLLRALRTSSEGTDCT